MLSASKAKEVQTALLICFGSESSPGVFFAEVDIIAQYTAAK